MGTIMGIAAFLRKLVCGHLGDEEDPTNINPNGSKTNKV